jgi:hypothetical protein
MRASVLRAKVEVTRLVQEKNASLCAFKDPCALKCRATDDAVDQSGARIVVHFDGIFRHNADLVEHLGHNLRHRGLARARIAEK